MLQRYPSVTTPPMPADRRRCSGKIFLSVVERIFPSSLVRLLLAALRGRKIIPKSHRGRTEGRIKADRNRMQKTFSFVQLSGTPLAPVCYGCGKRTDGLTWSGSVQLRGMPRYYRLRTVIPRRPRNSPADCCPCRSQARIIPLLETVSRLFKDICYIWNTKIPPVRSMSKRSSL